MHITRFLSISAAFAAIVSCQSYRYLGKDWPGLCANGTR